MGNVAAGAPLAVEYRKHFPSHGRRGRRPLHHLASPPQVVPQ